MYNVQISMNIVYLINLDELFHANGWAAQALLLQKLLKELAKYSY